jgi:CMP-N-acetylneuraminic acid synthetase
MKVLAIIPARIGSKGIPFKNIRRLAGKPLIEYAIKSAKKSRYIDKLVVSTDSKIIAKIARSAGAEVPFIRPKSISGDRALTIDVVKQAIEFLHYNQSYSPDIIVILQPTSPLRTSKIIDKSIKMLKKENATSVVSVSNVKHHPYISFWQRGKYLKPFIKNFERQSLRQKRTSLYAPTGSVYALWLDTLKKYNSLYGPRIKSIVEDETSLDIDSYFDFFLCEMVLKYWKKYKNTKYSEII